ncbi:hypothetical protein TNCV_5115051 [Trichonephila clavipes]|nr:hypothetical protein TNCV_5115051 [Trichonephila clavipes]
MIGIVFKESADIGEKFAKLCNPADCHPPVSFPSPLLKKCSLFNDFLQSLQQWLPNCQAYLNVTKSNVDRSAAINELRSTALRPSSDTRSEAKIDSVQANLGGRTGKILRPSSVALKSKNQEINRLHLAVKLPWAIFFESVDILS